MMTQLIEKKQVTPERKGEYSEVLESRAVFYETLAALYFKPLSQEQVDALAGTSLDAYAEINENFAQGIHNIKRYLRKQNTGTRQELAVDFTSAFAGVNAFGGRVAVPYKSVFVDEEGLLYGSGHREVFSDFKREAIKKREGLDWPDDHLSFMCEFMAVMSRRTEAALEEGQVEKAGLLLEKSQDFLQSHILSWFDDFEELANCILKTGFYRGVLSLSKGFFELDKETLQDLIKEIRQ